MGLYAHRRGLVGSAMVVQGYKWLATLWCANKPLEESYPQAMTPEQQGQPRHDDEGDAFPLCLELVG